ncbi:MAG: hypothetical protein LQ351_002707 [Letrouitia transgressa]|nr:MAG: hypothetical protein LQ351_002707 [Letrouitia transgressa]
MIHLRLCETICYTFLLSVAAATNLRAVSTIDRKNGSTVGELNWKDCSSEAAPTLQCATLDVPVDWDNPSGSQLTLFINKLPATNPSKRIGNLFFAPGGGGFSASEYVENMAQPGSRNTSETLREHFDIIGADQRGCGKSNPVTCDSSIFNAALRKNFFPTTLEGYEETLEAFEKLGKSCLEMTGEQVLAHMDTFSAVKDMEAIRVALGGAMTYLGYSYATQYGYTYAQLFPNNIRAMVLDAVLDHSYPLLHFEVSTIASSALVLQHFLDWAHENSSSPLFGKDTAQIYDQVVEKAKEKPLPAPGCAKTGACPPDVTEWEFRGNLINTLKVLRTWPSLAQGLADALEGDATAFATPLATSNNYAGMSHIAIACQDWNRDDGRWETQLNKRHALEALAARGIGFGDPSLTSIGCQRWPVPVTNPQTPINITSLSASVLMVHAMWDPALNYEMAVSMRQKIAGSHLLTRRGDGRGSYPLHGETSRAMERFLVSLEVPKVGTVYDS